MIDKDADAARQRWRAGFSKRVAAMRDLLALGTNWCCDECAAIADLSANKLPEEPRDVAQIDEAKHG